MMSAEAFSLRHLQPSEFREVADLIHTSTNAWYAAQGKGVIFAGQPDDCLIYPEVYQDLDHGSCFVVYDNIAKKIVASCFYHPRSTHISVGIVNVHPDYFGLGLAKLMINAVIEQAKIEEKPVRLVSSAMNLDSLSLYTRAGFVPRQFFQDMLCPVPEAGFDIPLSPNIRPATRADLFAIVALEGEVSRIEREDDWAYFIKNTRQIWRVFVYESEEGEGKITGVLGSVSHPASCIIGPGVARDASVMLSLIHAQLDSLRGKTPLIITPADAPEIVHGLYKMGAKNCETHIVQVYGDYTPPNGIVIPTFLPETG
jgi:GNAT superfamily N-acetyltransferase